MLARRHGPLPPHPSPAVDAPLGAHLDRIAAKGPAAVAGLPAALRARDVVVATDAPVSPPGVRVTLDAPLTVALRTTTLPDGTGRAPMLFESPAALAARDPAAYPLLMPGGQVLDHAEEYDGFVLLLDDGRWQALRSGWLTGGEPARVSQCAPTGRLGGGPMIFFGTRGKMLQRQVSHNQAVLLAYRYFHIWWLLRFAYGTTYFLATHDPQTGVAQRPITPPEAVQLLGGQSLTIPFWDRFSLPVVGGGGLLVLILLSTLAWRA